MSIDLDKLELILINEESFRLIHSVSKVFFGRYSIRTYKLDENSEEFEVKEYEYFNPRGNSVKKQRYLSTDTLPTKQELKETLKIPKGLIWITHINTENYKHLTPIEINMRFPENKK